MTDLEQKTNRNTIILLFVLLIPFGLSAQVQQGYVKTKGRLASNGVVIKGKPLSGVLVTVKGRNSVASRNNGTFTLPILENTFYLQNVQKEGYIIADPETVSRQYAYSSNPLIIVLEDEQQLCEDKQVAKDKIRETLFLQYKHQNDELKRKLEQNEIRKEDYDRMKARLDSLQDSNEALIKSMAEEYARIDYDQLNEFMTRVQQHIFNGELTKADSLLKTQNPNLDAEVRAFFEFQERNTKKRNEQIWRDSVEWLQKDVLAQRCYAKYQLFKLRHSNDSARYYIELRAELDTANITWQLEAGIFIEEFCSDKEDSIWVVADHKGAMPFYLRALRNAKKLYGENSSIVGRCYSHIANAVDETSTDVFYYEKALSIIQLNYGEESLEAAEIWRKMGQAYCSWHPDTGLNDEEGDSCFMQAIQIFDNIYGKNNLESLLCYLESDPDDKYVKKITDLLKGWGTDKQLEMIRIYGIISRKYFYDANKAERAHAEVYFRFSSFWVDDDYNYMFEKYDKQTWKSCKEAYTLMIEDDRKIIECYENCIDYYKKRINLMTAIYGEDYIPVKDAEQMLELSEEQMKYYQDEMKLAKHNLEIGENYKIKK